MNTISQGAQGADVTTLQRDLAALGYTITADGIFGNGTKSVVIQFQTDNGLTPDGVVGPGTWTALNNLLPASPAVQEVDGMYISHINDAINWHNLSPSLSFVICKASQGAGFKDPMFSTYRNAIQTRGLIMGAYHFLTFRDSAQAQADNFLACGLSFSDQGILPPIVDVEWQVPDSLNPYILQNRAACIQLIKDWLQIVQTQTGRTPIIYTARSFWAEYLGNPPGFENYPIWIAAYQTMPPGLPPGWNNYTFWQFSESGSVTGPTGGDIDWDRFNGTLDQLKALANYTQA
ncbi:MAG: GH25 family lysozyme [Mucilaginibacter sp.]